MREALQLGHDHIGTEHMLLGLLREGNGVAAQVLVSLGVDLSKVREEVMRILDEESISGVDVRIELQAVTQKPGQPVSQQGSVTGRAGKTWMARVVIAGRTPPDYEAAYEELLGMLERFGFAVDDPGATLAVRSVGTDGGPGLALTFSRLLEDESDPVEDGESR
jgi:hypothetical protein